MVKWTTYEGQMMPGPRFQKVTWPIAVRHQLIDEHLDKHLRGAELSSVQILRAWMRKSEPPKYERLDKRQTRRIVKMCEKWDWVLRPRAGPYSESYEIHRTTALFDGVPEETFDLAEFSGGAFWNGKLAWDQLHARIFSARNLELIKRLGMEIPEDNYSNYEY